MEQKGKVVHLVDILVLPWLSRKVSKDEDKYYNNHFVILHDLLRELAIRQSTEKPFEQDRLIIDITGNDFPEWWVGENQQGTIGQMFPCFSRMIRQKQLKVAARILCISTGMYVSFLSKLYTNEKLEKVI